jgi:hypothetical protein
MVICTLGEEGASVRPPGDGGNRLKLLDFSTVQEAESPHRA